MASRLAGMEDRRFSFFRQPERRLAFRVDENRRFCSVTSLDGQVDDWCALAVLQSYFE
ncbi:MAG: hypothetical protein MJ202_01295 [Lentisphaeria bacterium]|nr:hypothetical protein [Lentisphaeria bacterium]